MNKIFITILLLVFSLPSTSTTKPIDRELITIIHAGTLLAVPGQMPTYKQSLIIKNGKIVDVIGGYVSEKNYKEVGEVETINLKDKFVMPGMMDMHVHLTMNNGIPKAKLTELSDSDYALVATENARKTLMAGFTTVRDLTAMSVEAIIAVRDAINRNAISGPRILAAGKAITATAGHDDLFAVREDYAKHNLSSAVCDGADDCRRAVRAQYKLGANIIKVMATGGGHDPNGKADSAPELFDDELKAVVETAHRLNLKVAAHAHGTAGINAALEAGVDSIEHASYPDEKSIQLLLKTGAHIVPTRALIGYFLQQSTIPETVKKGMRIKTKVKGELLANAHKKGVIFSMGTDAGISPHGENAEELIAYVEIGMTAMESIETTTVNAASLIGRSADLGTLEKGKIADVIALSTNPLKDIKAVKNVVYVMRNGITYKSSDKTM